MKHFRAAKRAAKAVIKTQGGTIADQSAVHMAAIKVLRGHTKPEALSDIAWQAVLAAL